MTFVGDLPGFFFLTSSVLLGTIAPPKTESVTDKNAYV